MTVDPRDTDDADLTAALSGAGAGDEAAWRLLVDRYWRRLFALARSRLGGDEIAEEITQSVFATLADKLSSGDYKEQGRFESWLFRIAMNRVRDEARRRKRPTVPMEQAADAAAPSASQASEGELESLRAALSRLEEADREIISLRHHAGLSFKTIADLLEQPLGTVLARHHRALGKLRDLLTTGAATQTGEASSA